MKSLQGIRRTLISLAVLGLASRVFVPAGFMPAPLDEGWPIKICPSVLSGDALIFGTRGPAGSVAGHHARHDPHRQHESPDPAPHEHHSSGEEGAPHNLCPVGAFFASSALLESGEALVFAPEIVHQTASADSQPAKLAPVAGPQPRGPPSELPFYT